MSFFPHRLFPRLGPLAGLLLAAASLRAPASAGVAPGHVVEWPDTTLAGWTDGATYSNPGDGGFLGAGDGYLRMATPTIGRLAGFSTSDSLAGDWTAAGITRLEVALNDVDADDPLEIHVMLVSGSDLWIYTPGFAPPEHAWGTFTVDLGNAAAFTHVTGTGTWEQALHAVGRIQIRHDSAPFTQPADFIQADVGVDHLVLEGPSTPVAPTTWGRIKSLYR